MRAATTKTRPTAIKSRCVGPIPNSRRRAKEFAMPENSSANPTATTMMMAIYDLSMFELCTFDLDSTNRLIPLCRVHANFKDIEVSTFAAFTARYCRNLKRSLI